MKAPVTTRFAKAHSFAALAMLATLTGQLCSPAPSPEPNPPPSNCTNDLSDNIDSVTTLSAECYLVTSEITVNAPLTIDPGVTLEFQVGTSMTVSAGGSLNAVGTAAQPIVFTGEEPVRGTWGGLVFDQSDSSDNRLEYVTIEYGGTIVSAGLTVQGTADNPSRLAVTNSTLGWSSGFGFQFDDGAVITAFSHNTVTGNVLGAGYLPPNLVGSLDATTSYQENDTDVVKVPGGRVQDDQTWPGLDVPYSIAGNITVDADLSLDEDLTLSFDRSYGMTVQSDASLSAVGTSARRILFTGADQTRGSWAGVLFDQTGSVDNELQYVVVEYGGTAGQGAVTVRGTPDTPGRLRMSHCTLRGSAGYGFDFGRDVTIDQFSENTMTANDRGAGLLYPNLAGSLDDASSYSGNAIDTVELLAGSITEAQTWLQLDAPYLCSGDILVESDLIIGPGVTLVFNQNFGMTVRADGSLAALGTADRPITLTGASETPGYWFGLEYYASESLNNQLVYVTIEYGGGNTFGDLLLDGNTGGTTATNCTFAHSSAYGIYVGDGTTTNSDVAGANSFFDNADGNIFYESAVPPIFP